MPQPLRVLLVEDNDADAELILIALRGAGFEPEWVRVETEPEYLARLTDGFDVILSDYDLPQFSGPRALELLKANALEIPFIIISGAIGEETAVAAIRHGAADYLIKGHLARLESAILQAQEQHRLRREARDAAEKIRQLNAALEHRVAARTDALNRAVRELEAEIAERKLLEKEILVISDREQRRLGHDLHDDLCQQLAGIQFLTDTLAGELNGKYHGAGARMQEIAQLTRNAIHQTRELARGLSPLGLEAEGLTDALQTLTRRTEMIFRRECRFECTVPVFVPDSAVGIHLYRIAQEAISNAVKHGQAPRIEISLATQNGTDVVLRVSDNGLGIPEGKRACPGMGLRIMRYRADVINATLLFQNEPAGGTTVICTARNGLLPAGKQEQL